MKHLFLIFSCLLLTTITSAQDAPGVVKFPANLDSPDSLMRATNNARTTLPAPASAQASSIVVASTATFPASGAVVIDGEVILYQSKTATALTGLTRGADGTAATSHAAGVSVRGAIVAAHHNTLANAIIATQLKLKSLSSVDLPTTLNNKALTGTTTAENITSSGTVTATNFIGDAGGLTGLTGATGGVGNTGSTTIAADTGTPDGIGKVSIQTRSLERLGIENDGTANFTGSLNVGGMNVVTTPEAFGANGFDSADDTAAFIKLYQFLKAQTVSNRTVRLTPGASYRSAQNSWLLGLDGVRLEGNGATLIPTHPAAQPSFAHHALGFGSFLRSESVNTNASEVAAGGAQHFTTFRELEIHGDSRDLMNRNYIYTAPVGSLTLRLKKLAHVARYSVGTRVFLGGYSQQTGEDSFPPNLRYFEWNKVVAVNAATGVLTLETPTRYLYDERWLQHPALVIPIDKPDSAQGVELYIENLTIKRLHPLNTFNLSGYDRLIVKNLTVDRLVVSGVRHATLDHVIVTVDCELDKLAELIEFRGGSKIRQLAAGTGVQLVRITEDTEINGFLQFDPPRVEVDNARINIGGSGIYGKFSTGGAYAREQITIRNTGFVHRGEAGEKAAFVGYGQTRFVIVGEVINSNTFVVAQSDNDQMEDHDNDPATPPIFVNRPQKFAVRARIGTILHGSGGYADIKNIYSDDGVRLLCEVGRKSFDLAPGQVLTFNMLQNLTLDSNYWTNLPERGSPIAFGSGLLTPPAENVRIDGSSEPRILTDIPTNSEQAYVGVHGSPTEIEVAVTRAQVIDNAAFPNAYLVFALPSGFYKVNLKQVGVRRITRTEVTGVQLGDELYNPLGASPAYQPAIEFFGESTHTNDSSRALGTVTVKRTPRR